MHFYLPVKKIPVDSPCFWPCRFYSPSGVSPLPLTFIPQAANMYYVFIIITISVNHEFFCMQVYLIVVERLQCSG